MSGSPPAGVLPFCITRLQPWLLLCCRLAAAQILPRAAPPPCCLRRRRHRPPIPAGCATVAELRKRGDDFWGEFEFYLSDLLVGLVLDVVLVTLLAPPAIVGRSRAGERAGRARAGLHGSIARMRFAHAARWRR